MGAAREPELPPQEVDPTKSASAVLRVPAWTRTELAWPLALGLGFGATFLGLFGGISGLALLLACAAYAPLHWKLIGRAQIQLAALTSISWCIGIAAGVAAHIGLGVSVEALQRALPGAAAFAAADLNFLTPGDGIPAPAASELLLRDALVLFALGALARPLRGLVALPGIAASIGAIAAGGALWAPGLAFTRDELTVAAVQGWPPHLALAAAGLLFAAAAIADPRQLSALAGDVERRRLLIGGTLLACAGLGVGPFLLSAWRSGLI